LLRSLFAGPLPSNRRPTVACACIAGMCLPTRCLAVDIHVTISMRVRHTLNTQPYGIEVKPVERDLKYTDFGTHYVTF
jgi:hypothetical protein